MGWKEELLPGSFRGVSFKIDSAGGEIGRRVALHEYPLRDTPYAEDLGKKARRFTLEIYVLGDGYMAARDSLVGAFEKSGAGRLVHPYLGEMTATVVEVRGPRESTREGGMARFTATFVETGEAIFPAAETDTAAGVADKADLTIEAIVAEYERSFDVTGAPDFVGEHAETLLESVMDALDAARKSMPGIPGNVTEFIADLQGVSVSVESLVREPADLAVAVCGLVADVAGLTDRPERAFNAYRSLWDALADEPVISETTASRTRQAENQAALAALVQRAAVVEAVRLAGTMDFDSYDAAVTARDELCDELDDQVTIAADDTYGAMMDLKAALVADMAARSADLARIIYHTPKATLPALVIAHRLYDDPTMDEDIIARNSIRHPGLVPGGVALEVLSNA